MGESVWEKMEWKIVKSSEADGTWFQGYTFADLQNLTNIFGYPDADGEWSLLFTDGTIATIYRIVEPKVNKEELTCWHIGGYSKDAVKRVNDAIGRL